MLVAHNPGEPKPLRITVVIPPREDYNPIRAFVDLTEAMAYAKECLPGTRYASPKVEGDVVKELWPEHGWKEDSDGI